MTHPKVLQEFLDILGRSHDLFNVIDLAVLARRTGAGFSVLSVRVTVGRIESGPKQRQSSDPTGSPSGSTAPSQISIH